MTPRVSLTRLVLDPIASSSRLQWAPIRRSFTQIRSSPSIRTTLSARSVLPTDQSRRKASTATASSTDLSLPPLPPRNHIRVTPPSLAAIKEEGYLDDDVSLIPKEQASIIITPEAIRRLVSITSREPPDVITSGKLVLRCGVSSGGCHGYQYTMELTEQRGVDDYVMQPEGVNCIPVVVDLVSLGLLKGATLHHATELIGSSFRIQDNPQAKEGGACGCGVSWEAKL